MNIPEYHQTMAVRAPTRTGKSVFIANVVRLIDSSVYVLAKTSSNEKLDETKRIYSIVPNVQYIRSLPNFWYAKHQGCILVVEDFGLYSRNPTFFRQVEDLVKIKAGLHKIFTIVATHHSKTKLPTNLDVELSVKEGQRYYQVREEKRHTSWVECNLSSETIDNNKLDTMLQSIEKSIPGEIQGRRGRPTKEPEKGTVNYDIWQRKLSDQSNTEIAEALGKDLDQINVTVWKLRKRKLLVR